MIGKWSTQLAAPWSAVLVSVVWLAPMIAIKVRLLNAFVLTSDLAYYENMLHNTGVDFSEKSVDFLFTYRDVIYHNSRTFLTEHFSPTFGLLAPIYQLFAGPLTLIVLQPLLIALASWGIYRMARRLMEKYKVPPACALLPILFQIMYLFNYSNISATVDTVYGFHHDSLIPPLLIWALVCAFEYRWRSASVLFVLLLGMKENLPIIMGIFCVACLAFGWPVGRRRAAWGLAACFLFFTGCYLFEFRTGNRHVAILYRFFDFDNIYAALDQTPKWALLNTFWLGLLVPSLALPALAEFSLQLMGTTVGLDSECDWHSYPLMALAIAATLIACVRLASLMKNWRMFLIPLYLVFLAAIFVPVVAEGIHSYRAIYRGASQLTPLADAGSVKSIAHLIPANAKLCTSSDMLVSFANRRYLIWPELADYADWILVNRRSDGENAAAASRLSAIASDDEAASHFYGEINLAVSGYGYDKALYAYVDKLTAAHRATVMGREGNLVLYRVSR